MGLEYEFIRFSAAPALRALSEFPSLSPKYYTFIDIMSLTTVLGYRLKKL